MDLQEGLRERAESMLDSDDYSEYSKDEFRRLAHELAVHQIELEFQNQELREAQLKIVESRDTYQELYDFSPVGYVTLDKTGKIVEANLTATQLFGISRIDLLNKHFPLLCRAEPGNLTFCPDIPSDEDVMSEILFKKEGGDDFWGQVKVQYRADRKDNEPRVRLAIIDITDKKKAEQSIYDLAKFPGEDKNPVLRISKSGDLLYANPPATTFLEDLGERNGQPGCTALLSEMVEAMENWEPCTKIINCKHRPYSLAITPVAGQDYINVYGLDISDLRELEKQVRQKVKMEVIGSLAGGIAHDFNNILAVIMGFASLAEGEARPGALIHDHINRILDATDRAKDLVNKILSFSHQAHDVKKGIALAPILKEIHGFLRASLPASIEINLNLEETPPIFADPTRIHEVIMNLCSNAAFAMKGSGILEISTHGETLTRPIQLGTDLLDPGDYSVITIKDNGCGMTPEVLSHVLEPFFTTKDVGLGSGMGMAIVNEIIQDHLGFLDIQSQPDVGTTVRILIPATTMIPEVPSIQNTSVVGGTERILFVDDEPEISEAGQAILEKLGYTVSTFTDSLEALAVFKDNPDAYDLVISDQTMPGLSGMEFSAEVLNIRPNMPIIICTGYSPIVDEEKAIASGIKVFSLKPLSLKELAIKVRAALDTE